MARKPKQPPRPPRAAWGAGTVKEVREGVWRAWRARINGQRPSRTFYGPSAETQARQWAAGEPEPSVMLLGPWLAQWLRLRAPTLRPATVENYERFILACEPLALRPLPEITTDDWQALVNDLLSRWSRKHVMAWRGIISAALNAAVPRWAPENALRGVRLPKPVDEPPKAWTRAEAARLLAAAEGRTHHVWLWLALSTGLRLGELRGLQWADVDLQVRTVTVRRSLDNETDEIGPTKSGKVRTVDLPDEIVSALVAFRARQPAGQRFVFGQSRDGLPIRAQSYRRWLWSLCKAAGVAQLTPHSTRHTFASLALDAGVPIQDIAQALGHASVATTLSVYSWYLGRGQRRAANALGQMLSQPVRNVSGVVSG